MLCELRNKFSQIGEFLLLSQVTTSFGSGRLFGCADGLAGYCDSVKICQHCMTLLREDRLPTNFCRANHDWIFIPPLPEQEVPPGHILVGDEVMKVDDWVQNMKKEWGLWGIFRHIRSLVLTILWYLRSWWRFMYLLELTKGNKVCRAAFLSPFW